MGIFQNIEKIDKKNNNLIAIVIPYCTFLFIYLVILKGTTTKITMSDDQNGAALDIWGEGWSRGDSAIIYRVLDDSFTFSGLPNKEAIDKRNFKMYWVGLRATVEETGGPKSVSGHFAILKNTIRRKVCIAIFS